MLLPPLTFCWRNQFLWTSQMEMIIDKKRRDIAHKQSTAKYLFLCCVMTQKDLDTRHRTHLLRINFFHSLTHSTDYFKAIIKNVFFARFLFLFINLRNICHNHCSFVFKRVGEIGEWDYQTAGWYWDIVDVPFMQLILWLLWNL